MPHLVGPDVPSFDIIYKSTVYDFIPTGSGVISGKIPVTFMLRTCLMQVFNSLVNDADTGFAIGRSDQFRNFFCDFLRSKRGIENRLQSLSSFL